MFFHKNFLPGIYMNKHICIRGERMKDEQNPQNGLYERAVVLGEYIIENKATVRGCAEHFSKQFGISKSTVHKDLSQRLPQASAQLYLQVKEILEQNKQETHIRGGLATKHKYEELAKISKKA